MLRAWRPRPAVWVSLAFVVGFCAGLTPALHLHVDSHTEHRHHARDCAYCDVILTGATAVTDEPGPVITNQDLWRLAGSFGVATPMPGRLYEPTAPRGPPAC